MIKRQWILLSVILRYNGNGVQQIGVTLEGASPHDSGRWTLRVPTLEYGDHWVTKHFMVTVGNSSIIPETPRLTTDMDLPIYTRVSYLLHVFLICIYVRSMEASALSLI